MSKPIPTWLYCRANITGQLFTTLDAAAIADKLDNGWYTSPADIPPDPVVGDGAADLASKKAAAAPAPKPAKQPEIKVDADALRAMFLTGKALTPAQVKELATALGVKFKPVGEKTSVISAKIEAALKGDAADVQDDDDEPDLPPPLTPAQ